MNSDARSSVCILAGSQGGCHSGCPWEDEARLCIYLNSVPTSRDACFVSQPCQARPLSLGVLFMFQAIVCFCNSRVSGSTRGIADAVVIVDVVAAAGAEVVTALVHTQRSLRILAWCIEFELWAVLSS